MPQDLTKMMREGALRFKRKKAREAASDLTKMVKFEFSHRCNPDLTPSTLRRILLALATEIERLGTVIDNNRKPSTERSE